MAKMHNPAVGLPPDEPATFQTLGEKTKTIGK
jgi:hypothetical protein